MSEQEVAEQEIADKQETAGPIEDPFDQALNIIADIEEINGLDEDEVELLRTLDEVTYELLHEYVQEQGLNPEDLEERVGRRPQPSGTNGSQPEDEETEDSSDTWADASEAEKYHEQDGRLFYEDDELANFTARIQEEVHYDDGNEETIRYRLTGENLHGEDLPPVDIPAGEFQNPRKLEENWGRKISIYHGQSRHIPLAIKTISNRHGVPEKRVFGHTGWRQIHDQWVYLHANGAIGPEGTMPSVEVDLALEEGPMNDYALQVPPNLTSNELAEAIQASLQVAEPIVDRIAFSLLAATYRSIISGVHPASTALYLKGPTHTYKSVAMALMLGHYGAGFNDDHLPASWNQTSRAALRALLARGRDVPLGIDDFLPDEASNEKEMRNRFAEVYRAQANRAPNLKMNPGGQSLSAGRPKGLLVSTGEELPNVRESILNRMLTLNVEPGDIDIDGVDPLQDQRDQGVLATAMGGFAWWLAHQGLDDLIGPEGRLAEQHATYRNEATDALPFPSRVGSSVAQLFTGFKLFTTFAEDVGALPRKRLQALDHQAWESLLAAARGQTHLFQTKQPVPMFFHLLKAVLRDGEAHLQVLEGDQPSRDPARWGWTRTEEGWEPQGACIGYGDGTEVYLDDEAAFPLVKKRAAQDELRFTLTREQLRKRLADRGTLLSTSGDRNALRKTIRGTRDYWLHLPVEVMINPSR